MAEFLSLYRASWTVVDKDGLHTYSSVWGTDPSNVYFGGAGVASDFPNAKHWDGNSLNPFTISDKGVNNLAALTGTGPANISAVVDQPFTGLYRLQQAGWENSTPSFSIEPVLAGAVYTATVPSDHPVYFAVGQNGSIYHHDGSDWEDVSVSGETRDFHAVWVSPGGRIFVVGEELAVYMGSVDEPTEWTLMPTPPGTPTGDFTDVWGSSDDDVYITGSGKLVFHLTPGG